MDGVPLAPGPLQVRHHVMSLYLLNEHRTDISGSYRRTTVSTRGPARVATAAVAEFGEDVLDGFYAAFGARNFDVWRHPSEAELHTTIRATLHEAGLPAYGNRRLRHSHRHGHMAQLG